MIGIGIDTGGTCTDAVVFDTVSRKVLSWSKTLTTKEDLKEGILRALKGLESGLLHKADYIALSTTLATNACVEGKGGRAKLIMMGLDPRAVSMMEGAYGLPDVSDIYFMDCRPDINPKLTVEPDWEKFRRDIRESKGAYEGFAVVQTNPQLDGGAFERRAEEIIKEETGAFCVRGYELFQEVNAQKRAATALLNARLMPLIVDFFTSIEESVKEMGLDLNIYVMKSDGTVMSKDYAMERPVETLLCGPAASIRGAIELTGISDGIIIDMGGTTSDIASVRGGRPVASDGVHIGGWRTMVRGVDIDTFALGGDTGIIIKDNEPVLDERRVIPISVLASVYPDIIRGLREIARKFFSFPLKDGLFLVLIRRPEDLSSYSAKEREIIDALGAGPLSYLQLEHRLGISHRFLNIRRLEDEGIVMRSGITPTDAMHILGDYTEYSVEAAELGMKYLVTQVRKNEIKTAHAIYDLVVYRLFKNLVHIQMRYELGDAYGADEEAAVEKLTAKIFDDFKNNREASYITADFVSRFTLIGVGAPTGIFLKDTASLLKTDHIISEYSMVANAVGAACGDIVTEYTVTVRVTAAGEYMVSGGDEVYITESYREALEAAEHTARKKAEEKARAQAPESRMETTVDIEEDKFRLPAGSSVLLSTKVTAGTMIIL